MGVSTSSIRPLWFAALLRDCSSIRINVKAPHRTSTPGLYILYSFFQSQERRGLRLSWKGCQRETAIQHAAFHSAQMSSSEQGLTWENVMRKCSMGTPRNVMKAVLLSMPIISIFFSWWLFFLLVVIILYYVWVCVSFLCWSQDNVGYGVRESTFSSESKVKLNDSPFD